MKKIIKVLLVVALFLMCSIGFSGIVAPNAAALDNITDGIVRSVSYEYLVDFIEYNGSTRKYIDRRAGTIAEYLSANYIASKLEFFGLEAKTYAEDVSIAENNAGMQKFSFENYYTGQKDTSQNVIYTLKGKTSNKKVVISASYDNYYEGYIGQDDQVIEEGEDFSDGINASAASVAVMLSLAELLPVNYFDFDIEFVFFGAGYHNNAGAVFYNQCLKNSEREKVLLMLDISRIALGDYIYYYSGAFGSHADSFYEKVFTINKYKHSLSGAATENYNNALGYSNAGYSSSTAIFEGRGINVLHIFAGSYKSGVFGGECEYIGKSNITNTQKDSLDYIVNTYGQDLTNNMAKAIKSVISLLEHDSFVNQLSQPASIWQYKVFSAKNYIILIMLVVLILLLMICIIIHYKLSRNAYKFVTENKIDGVVLQIDENDSNSKDKQI